jgi:thymidine kinase
MGKITLIIGCMFASKSTTMIQYLNQYQFKKKKCITIKYSKDDRYNSEADGKSSIVTHDKMTHLANFSIDKLLKLPSDTINNADIILIDEGQFFCDIVNFSEMWADRGKHVIVAALNGTFEREPFPEISRLISCAEKIVYLNAICTICFKSASFSKRLIESTERELIGGSEAYEARCRKCRNI